MSLIRYHKNKSNTLYCFDTTPEGASKKKKDLIDDIKANDKGIIDDTYRHSETDLDKSLLKLKDDTLPESPFEGEPIYGNILKYKEVAYR